MFCSAIRNPRIEVGTFAVSIKPPGGIRGLLRSDRAMVLPPGNFMVKVENLSDTLCHIVVEMNGVVLERLENLKLKGRHFIRLKDDTFTMDTQPGWFQIIFMPEGDTRRRTIIPINLIPTLCTPSVFQ